MRALYVPVRLAATVMAVAAAAGCMSVGDDGDRPAPSHSAGHRGGEAPDGGPGVSGGGAGFHGAKGAKGDGGSPKPGESVSGSASPSASVSGGVKPSAKATEKGGPGRPVEPGPTKAEPSPTRTTAEPTPEPPPPPVSSPPVSEPSTAEPSSSAHEQATQLMEREAGASGGEPV